MVGLGQGIAVAGQAMGLEPGGCDAAQRGGMGRL